MPTRNEFYGDLALWSTLAVGKDQRNDVKRKLWQRFLDDLCYLCDTESGGRTTVSIAVSELQRGQCFWISANGKLQKAVDQLKLILKELDSIQENQNTNLEEIKDKVLVAGIGRSSMKVRNYLRELRRYIELMERRSPLGKDVISVKAFRGVLETTTHRDASMEAYRLRSSQDYRDLKDYITKNPSDCASRQVRHYLGRVASWAKSASFVVQATSSHDVLQYPIKIRQRSPQQSTILDGSVRRDAKDAMVASLLRAGVEEAPRSCESKWLPLLEVYAKRWESLRLRTSVHAEMTILDLFHRRSLQFAHGKRYIGCSKPSCFCCGVYMANHPLNIEERPCHNNVWVKWSPPRTTGRDSLDVSECSTDPIVGLGNVVKRKIREELSCGAIVSRQRLFDSTTDLSASLPTIFNSIQLSSTLWDLGRS